MVADSVEEADVSVEDNVEAEFGVETVRGFEDSVLRLLSIESRGFRPAADAGS
jgi:hypothetical protein